MKILFIFRNKSSNQEVLVTRQILSLRSISNEIEIFSLQIKGKTIASYLTLFYELPAHIKKLRPSLLHAHYGVTILFVLLIKKLLRIKAPLVASFMGADILGDKIDFNKNSISSLIIQKLCLHSLNHIEGIIVKSQRMLSVASKYSKKDIFVIPNGVDTKKFYPIDRNKARELLGIEKSKVFLVFVTNDPTRKDKNLPFAQKIVERMKDVELVIKYNLDIDELNLWYNASNGLLLTSLSEGSPNVIKEAMATNTPIVSSDVGDIRFLFGDLEGYYISKTFELDEFIYNAYRAIDFSKTKIKTKGRERIFELGIDSESIAKKIVNLYSQVSLKE